MEYVYKHMDWSNVEILGRNRLPVRPFYCGYPNKESARQGRREECSNYRLLNGQWKFAYYESRSGVWHDAGSRTLAAEWL